MYVFHGTREELVEAIHKLVGMFVGSVPDRFGTGTAFRTAIGYTLVANIYEAFIVKSRGGTDEMGIQWPPLAPSTIAGRKVGKTDKRKDPDIKARQKIYDKEYKKLLARFVLNLPLEKAKRAANRRANAKALEETGATKIATLGHRKVEILVDTHALSNSLIPGTLTGTGLTTNYTTPDVNGGEDQVFKVADGEIVIGSDRPYAWVHQWGTDRIPRRQFLPDEDTELPDAWNKDMEQTAEGWNV